MKIVQTVKYSREFELERIVQITNQISNGFYQSKRFFISHHPVNNPRVIYLPNISFFNEYWHEVRKITEEPINNPECTKVSKLLSNSEIETISDEKIEEIKKEINKISKELEKGINKVFDNLDFEEIDITIVPTLYGSNMSFPKIQKKGKKLIIDYIWVRTDNYIPSLVEGIVSMLVQMIKKDSQKWQEDNWELNEGIVDFIVSGTSLSKYTKKYIGTLESLKNEQGISENIINSSKEIYSKLGFPIKNILEVKKGNIVKDNLPLCNLTNTEINILMELIEKKGEIVSFERIGEILWKDNDDEYSPWAIAKNIQRLRENLKKNNIYSELIHTLRNRGYVLYD